MDAKDLRDLVRFDEDTPMNLIGQIRPDVLVKGADYAPDAIVGAAWVEARGGRVVRIPVEPGHSTTAIIRKIRDAYLIPLSDDAMNMYARQVASGDSDINRFQGEMREKAKGMLGSSLRRCAGDDPA